VAKVEVFKLYGGEVGLSFEPGRHIYRVTDPVKGLFQEKLKPALVSWAANMAAQHVAGKLEPGVALDEVEIAELVREAKIAWRRKRDKAADLGTIIHNWIEAHIKSQIDPENNPVPELPKNEQVRATIQQFLHWEKENRVRYIASELHRIDSARVIRIGRDGTGFEAPIVIRRSERTEYWRAFKAAKELYDWKQKHDPPRNGRSR